MIHRVTARYAVSGETVSSHYRGAPFIPGVAIRKEGWKVMAYKLTEKLRFGA